ncbi:MAG: hypothetical protein Q8O75_01125 [bacterium]|nr:hypothetical protein [bacterium]
MTQNYKKRLVELAEGIDRLQFKTEMDIIFRSKLNYLIGYILALSDERSGGTRHRDRVRSGSGGSRGSIRTEGICSGGSGGFQREIRGGGEK